MNIFSPVPPVHAGVANGGARWKTFGMSVIAGFTWTELIVVMLLAIMLLEFIHY